MEKEKAGRAELPRRTLLLGGVAALAVVQFSNPGRALANPTMLTPAISGRSSKRRSKERKRQFEIKIIKRITHEKASDGTKVTVVVMDTEPNYLPEKDTIAEIIKGITKVGLQSDMVVLDSDSADLLRKLSEKANIPLQLQNKLVLPGAQIYRGFWNALLVPSPRVSIDSGVCPNYLLGVPTVGFLILAKKHDASLVLGSLFSVFLAFVHSILRDALNDVNVMLNIALQKINASNGNIQKSNNTRHILIIISEKNI